MIYYILLVLKTNGKIIQLGKQDKNLNVIIERRKTFLRNKHEGLRPFHTTHTEIRRIISKKRKERKNVKRYPVGTTATTLTKRYTRRYHTKKGIIIKKFKPHRINLGGKYMP